MTERDWLVPSIALTCLSGAFAILLIPDYSGVLPAMGLLPMWMIVAALLASIYAFFRMAMAGVQSPCGRIGQFIREDRRTLAIWTFGVFLAGINMTTFMWTKPLLNYLVPFWADPLLANIDNALFLGHDPWTLLTWLNSTPAAIFYHRGWFAIMILTLVVVLSATPSRQRSASLLTYFLLWSVIGPLIHVLLPAVGPIFYAQMGYGDRFADLQGVAETNQMAAYLWQVYAGEGFGPGSGISAMPSMHIATTAWMMISIYLFARRWFVAMCVAAVMIFLLSIALGWHYAADGIVGAAAAVACYKALLAVYGARSASRQAVAIAA